MTDEQMAENTIENFKKTRSSQNADIKTDQSCK